MENAQANDCSVERTEAITETIVVKREFVEIQSRTAQERTRTSSDSSGLRTIKNIYTDSDSPANLTRKSLNKSAYIKLHRSSFHHPKSSNVGTLKQKYETNKTDNDCANTCDANIDSDSSKGNNGSPIIKDQINYIDVLAEHKNTEAENNININDPRIGPSGDEPDAREKSEKNATEKDVITKTTTNIENLQNKLSTKLPLQAVESLKKKYSPASFGYPKVSSLANVESKPKKVTFAPIPPSIKPTPPPRPNLKPLSPTTNAPEKHTVIIKDATSIELPKSDQLSTVHIKKIEEEPLQSTSTQPTNAPSKEIEKPETLNEEVAALKVEKTKPVPPPRRISSHINTSPNTDSTKTEIFDIESPISDPPTSNSSSSTPTSTSVDVIELYKDKKLIKNSPTDSDTSSSDIQSPTYSVLVDQTDFPINLSPKPLIPKKPTLIAKDQKRPISAIELPIPAQRNAPRRPLSNIERRKPPLPTILSEEEIVRGEIIYADPEDIHLIVRRSSSEDSEAEISKVRDFLDDIYTMDRKKEKKRSNSFRKILTGGFFGKDKKKDEDKKRSKEDEKKGNSKKVDNNVFSDNVQNESNFNRSSSNRNTVGNTYSKLEPQFGGPSGNFRCDQDFPFSEDNVKFTQNQSFKTTENPKEPAADKLRHEVPKEVESRFAEMHINRYNQIRDNFAHSNINQRYEGYVDMGNTNTNSKRVKENFTNINAINKYIDTSSSNTISSESRSDTYENALIAQAEMMQRREEEIKMQQERNDRLQNKANARNRFFGDHSDSNSPEPFSATPPRAHDTYQNLQLIKPKALIPINSERPLPNPYHNGQTNLQMDLNHSNTESKTIDRNLNANDKKQFNTKSGLADNKSNKIETENVYGTVYDIKPVSAQVVISRSPQGLTSSLKDGKPRVNSAEAELRPMSPLSPRSLEGSKLKLPPNREKVELQPRIKSPIPQTKVSTDKIIATELLKNKSEKKEFDKRTTPSHQRLEIDIDYPESGSRSSDYSLSPRSAKQIGKFSPKSRTSLVDPRDSPGNRVRSPKEKSESLPRHTSLLESQRLEQHYVDSPGYRQKSPIPSGLPRAMSPRQNLEQHLEAGEWQRKQRELAASPLLLMSPNQVEVIVHTENNQPRNSNVRSPTPLQGRSPILYTYSPASLSPRSAQSVRTLSPPTQEIRASTPVNLPQSLKLHSPSKAEMRQHVEAFCWKELKKLKQKEEQEIYQIQLSNYGYAEDPVVTRRCRSVSPSSARGRRSLSLPREQRPNQRTDYIRTRQQPIPENRVTQINPNYGYIAQTLPHNQNFLRNAPHRRTIDTTYGTRADQEVEYRPIFKRGSLTYNPQTHEQQMQMNKKVSFPHGASRSGPQNWPTKNGFTQSPPTRRIEKRESYLEDEVFYAQEAQQPPQSSQNQGYMTYETPHGNKITVPMGKDGSVANAQGDARQYYQQHPGFQASLAQESMYGTKTSAVPPTNARVPRTVQESPYGTRSSDPRLFVQEDPYYTATRRQQVDLRQRNVAQEAVYGSRPSSTLPVATNMEETKIDGRGAANNDGQKIKKANSFRRSDVHDHNMQVRDNLLAKEPPKQTYITANKSAKELYEQRRTAQANRTEPQYVSRQQVARMTPQDAAYEEQQRLGGMYVDARMNPRRVPAEIYVSRQQVADESPYGSKQAATRPENFQLRRGVPPNMQYASRESQYASRESQYSSQESQYVSRESPYGSRQSFNVANPLYGSKQSVAEPIYGQRQVTLSNKVCDMYGKIHDTSGRQVVSPTSYGQVHETGVLYGQLQQSARSPPQNYQQQQQPPSSFVRGSRLTASANDMYKRQPPMQKRIPTDTAQNLDYVYDSRMKVLGVRPANELDVMLAPTRPLPPTPNESKAKFLLMRRESSRRYAPVYDGDTSSETSEVQRIMQNGSKNSSKPPGK